MQFRVVNLLPVLGFLAGLILLGGCATKTFAPDTAPEYVTVKSYSPFYRFGPMQGGGPDASLPINTRFKLLRQEMGYSLVQLDDTRTGYVANENMAPAPPRPPSPPASVETDDDGPWRGSSSRNKRPNSPRFQGEQVNDTPLPSGPPPDLNIAPEVVPEDPPPAPTPPAEKPRFRY